MASHILPASNAFRASHIELFDFALPAAAAMWNLRWQVRGYIEAKPDVSATELSDRFVFGSGLNYRNLRAPFEATTWESQQDEFARFLLANLISLFEGYVGELESAFSKQGLAKSLQFPSANFTSRKTAGINDALSSLTAQRSSVMVASFSPVLIKQARYRGDDLDELMVMYRYFKEIRNAFAHRNGVAESYMEQTYHDAVALGSWPLAPDLRTAIPPIAAGKRVSIGWKNVQSLSELLLVVVTSIDAILASTAVAEAAFLDAWRLRYGNRFMGQALPAEEERRSRKLQNLTAALGLPVPRDPERLFALLRENRLAS